MESIGHGEYRIHSANICRSSINNSEAQADIVEIEPVDPEKDIYRISNSDRIVAKVTEDTFLEVKRINFNLSDQACVQQIIIENGISGTLAEDMLRASERFSNAGRSVSAELYTSARAGSTPYYYTYNRINMRLDEFSISNDSFGYIDVISGADTASIAATIVEFLVSKIAPLYTSVSLGYDLLSLFTSVYGNTVIQGAGTDYLQADIQYDGTIRYVYAQIGGDWYLGYQGESVSIDWVKINQKYVVNGVARSVTKNAPLPSQASSIQAEHYSSYNQAAINNYANTLQEFCSYKIYNLVFDFRFV